MARIPFSYNFRSLGQRRLTTIATAAGVALVVFVFAAVNMLAEGIKRTLGKSGSPDIAIVLSKGADAELSSNINVSHVSLITAPQQVARRSSDAPDGVGEIVGVIALDKEGTTGISNVQIRGVTDAVWDFRPSARIIAGRKPNPGSDEVAVGTAIRGRFRGIELGERFEIRKNRDCTVVGIFADDGSSYESEVWADHDTVRTAFGREGLVSSVRVRLNSERAFEAFKRSLESNRQLGVQVLKETEYYEQQSEGMAIFITALGYLIAFFFSIGAMIGAMITMYSAVANRTREIGVLRALGFSRFAILTSFLFESVLLALIGGLIGAAASMACGLIRFSVVNFASFSEMVFTFEPTPGVIIGALVFAGFMGVAGGFFPAIRAARVRVLDALRG